jgi:hypothetical protein
MSRRAKYQAESGSVGRPSGGTLGACRDVLVSRSLDEPQPVLELREAELELLELGPGHQTDLVEQSGQTAPGALAQANALVAPAADQLVDE